MPDDPTQSIPPASDPRDIAASHQRRLREARPPRIGPYKILETLGEGGMGTVYLAEQTSPVHRRVALKIVKLGMDTKQVVARFEAEREALALMNHPGVAKVFDAGVSDEGRSYFVMEYVPGISITDYCDRNRLSTNERLQLFMQVCHAVQHAHQKGIIHRDLKPSNVLVAVQDGAPVPKVIDFGVAKATQQKLTEQTLFTEQGQLVGTPGYMSPEQAEMSTLGVDTRTDIYSLGVLLYELLVGSRPFDDEALRRAGFAEIQRIIREVEPPKPSTRLSSLDDSSTQIAQKRRTELRALSRILRGDLDWIVMKCLEKDRNRRYDTANGLALEIQRYLSNEPVLAGPPGAAYRLRKFVRRNRVGVLAGSSVFICLVGGLTVSTVFYSRSEHALKREAKRAEELKQVTRFQAEQLSGIDVPLMGVRLRKGLLNKVRVAAGRTGQGDIAARTETFERLIAGVDFTGLALTLLHDNFFKTALEAIDKQFDGQPLVAARLLDTISTTLSDLGLYDGLVVTQERTLRVRRNLLGDDHPDTLTSMHHMARLLVSMGKYTEAEPYCREALQRRRRVLGDDHPDTLESINGMGSLLDWMGKYAEAEQYYREALERKRRVLGDDHPNTLTSVNKLGSVLSSMGRYAEAEPYHREALEGFRRVLGDDHPNTLNSIDSMCVLLVSMGEHAEVEACFREALEGFRRVLGDDHPNTLTSINNMARMLHSLGKYTEAERYHREALEGHRRVLGDDHPATLNSINNIAYLLASMGKYAEAEQYNREGLERKRRVLGDDHPSTLNSVNNLGSVLSSMGKHTEAVNLLQTSEAAARRVLAGNSELGMYLAKLGDAYTGTGAFTKAESTLLESHEILASGLGEEHERTVKCVNRLINLYSAWHAAEPGEGYDTKATDWRGKLAKLNNAAG